MDRRQMDFHSAKIWGMLSGMRRVFIFLVVMLVAGLGSALPASAAHTHVQLVFDKATARPGETVMAGLHLRMDPGWHTYWRNPGGPGIPTSIEWTLPKGVTTGEIQWPIPAKFLTDDEVGYGYTNETVLLVPLKVGADAPKGTLDLKGHLDWLECELSCVPGKTDVKGTFNIGDETKASPEAALIETWKKKIPVAKADPTLRAWWEGPAKGDARTVVMEWPGSAKEADFYPFANDKFEVAGKTTMLSAPEGKIRISKEVKKSEGDWPDKIPGLLVEGTGDERTASEVSLSVTSDLKSSAVPGPRGAASGGPVIGTSLWLMLVYAFIGGLILNVMPCVLPVIALKILGFVNQAKEHPQQVRKLGLVYGLGVLVSFLVLAGLVIAVQQVGHAASWGMQFQNPQFLIAMTVLVTLVALNLFGLFEITLSGKLMGAAGDLASKEGSAGAFFNGVLATALATPCTAPFLGAALGFAFTQPPGIIVLVFLTVGLGLAAPYVVLSWEPALLKFLPKPGAWMEKFKMAMGFPMLATAVWLYTLAAPNFGEDGEFWLGIFLVVIGLVAWIWGDFVQRGRKRKGFAMAVCAVLLVSAYAWVLEGELRWRRPVSTANGTLKNSPEGIAWQAWTPEALQSARATGRPILVDFTAKWCATCQVNKRTSIEIPSVRAKLKEINAIALLENSFTKDATVVAELNRYQRAGVPLVLVYPRDPNAPPQVLPELLTPGIVLDALDKAAKQTAAGATVSSR